MNLPWLRRGTWELRDSRTARRTAEAALRGIESAFANTNLWLVAREESALVMSRRALILEGLVSRRFWWWRDYADVPMGFRRATLRVEERSGGIGVSYELDCASSFLLVVLLNAMIIGGFFSASGFTWVATVLSPLVPISIALYLAIPRGLRAYLRQAIDRPPGPSNSVFDSLVG